MSKIIKSGPEAAPPRRNPGSKGKDGLVSGGAFQSLEDLWMESAASGDGKEARAVPLNDAARNEILQRKYDEIVEQARQAAAAIEQEAFQKGFARGEEEARQSQAEQVRLLQDYVAGIPARIDELIRPLERDALELVKALLDRLVEHEVSVNPAVIAACLQSAMGYVVENSVVRIRLNPEDFNRIKEAALDNPSMLEGKGKVQLIEDPSVSLGGCLLDTDFGEIDATLENRRRQLLTAVDQAFAAAMQSGDAPAV